MPEKPSMPVKDLLKDTAITIELTGMRSFRWRVKAGRALLWLAAKVIGCGVEIKDAPDADR